MLDFSDLNQGTISPPSGWRLAWHLLIVSIAVIGLTIGLYWVTPERVAGGDRSTVIDAGYDCNQPEKAVTLPFIQPGLLKTGRHNVSLCFDVRTANPNMGLFIPTVQQHLRILADDEVIYEVNGNGKYPASHWNTGVYVSLTQDTRALRFDVGAYRQEAIVLYPFLVAPRDVAQPKMRNRLIMSMAVAFISLGVVLLMIVILCIVAIRRSATFFWWMVVTNLAGGVIVLFYFLRVPIGGYEIWMRFFLGAVAVFCYGTMRFSVFVTRVNVPRFLKMHTIWLSIVLVTVVIVPGQFLRLAGQITMFVSLIAVGPTILMFWWSKDRLNQYSTLIFLALFTLVLSIAFHDYFLFFTDIWIRPHFFGQANPLIMGVTTITLLITLMLEVMKDLEDIQKTLIERVDQKTKELKTTYQRLANVEQRVAVNNERNRISRELHDGVGNQLVNTIATLDNKDVEVDVLRSALQNALTDVGLIMNSMEETHTLHTLLGALRERFEGMLHQNGVTFDWQLGEEPALGYLNPQQMINVMRIFQEAVGNTLKHSVATKITVKTDVRTLEIIDDGKPRQETAGPSTGRGMENLKSRAQALGAEFTFLQASGDGSTVRLTWFGK